MENLKVEYPEFQFKQYKVRVLTSIPIEVYSTLRILVESYNECESNIENNVAVRHFILNVSFGLFYPIQVCPINSSSADEKK